MTWKLLMVCAAALFLGSIGHAQGDCPREKAQSVPRDITYGPSVSCGGLSYSLGGLSLSTTTGCPLFVLITPAHEIAVPTSAMTKVEHVGNDAVRIFFFSCRTSYLLFIPISSTCVFDNAANAGTVMRLVTVSCTDADA
jgi:hypothetical protein